MADSLKTAEGLAILLGLAPPGPGCTQDGSADCCVIGEAQSMLRKQQAEIALLHDVLRRIIRLDSDEPLSVAQAMAISHVPMRITEKGLARLEALDN